jgi:hypothetical protein
MSQTVSNPESAMLKELREAKESAARTAATGEGGNPNGQAEELTPEASALEASPEATEVEAAPAEETPAAPAGEVEEPIRINGQIFATQREAFAYADQLAREKELTDAHAQGIREALEATRQPVATAPEPEDNFEERFYSNPKEELKNLKAQATAEAVQIIKAEQAREKIWNDFLNENPDIRRKDAERILSENWDVIGKMTDLKQGQKVLAQKVRAEYDEITQLTKPRTVLADKKQVQSPSGGAPKGVTPKKEEAPLAFAQQMRTLFKR